MNRCHALVGDDRKLPTSEELHQLAQEVNSKAIPSLKLEKKWTLATPVGPSTFVGRDLWLRIFADARRQLDVNVKIERAPLVLTALGATGSGKSRLCDEALDLLDPGGNGVPLKVTYNLAGTTTLDADSPVDGLLWRIAAAASGLDGLALVPDFITQASEKWKISAQWLDSYLDEMYPGQLRLVVIDELKKVVDLAGKALAPRLLSALSSLTKHDGDQFQQICLITSLSHEPLNVMSESDRPPLLLPHFLLDHARSVDLVKSYLQVVELSRDHMQIVLKAGGHPRSLIFLCDQFTQRNRVPSVCELRLGTPLAEKDVLLVLTRSYQPITLSDISREPHLHKLLHTGHLLFLAEPEEKREAELNPADRLSFDRKGRIAAPAASLVQSLLPTSLVYPSLTALLQEGASSKAIDPTKQLEFAAFHADSLRNSLGLHLVPPAMRVTLPLHKRVMPSRSSKAASPPKPAPLTPDQWSRVKFCFPQGAVQLDTKTAIIGSHGAIDITELPTDVVYFSDATNQAGFEFMYFGEVEVAKVAVFHQEKINDDVKEAVAGLNTAAKQLRAAGWAGHVLFIVVALDGKIEAAEKSTNEPLLFVNRDNAHWYFTPSLSVVAETLLHQHRGSVASKAQVEADERPRLVRLPTTILKRPIGEEPELKPKRQKVQGPAAAAAGQQQQQQQQQQQD
jgi:hypothetical protein